ncbi:DNA-entry nuclease inhibitor [Bacillus rhizoplanae]|uniref:DNA-entry nuclease inhibitor n=1 Tax=Bacillus rhizoplanae TaxID=2880966 RepID=A0ABN7ZV70_9BACI|nr:competence protein ComJ [Bacillus rhizoplanae]CAG9610986.1 DNA-entry nuclease inhibitor [Bacillus rhizoplanae]
MELTISYAQLIVMNQGMTSPHVDWTDKDFERGYAEAEGTIIFEALSDYTCEVMVFTQKFVEKKEAIRTVSAPFTVLQEGVFISSVLANQLHFLVPSGEYIVTVQAIPLEEPSVDALYKIRYELFFEEN